MAFLGIAVLASGITLFSIVNYATADESTTEIRDDGVVVIHNSDGSKLFKVGIEDGVGTKSEINKQISKAIKEGIIGTDHPCNLDETIYMVNASEPNVNYTLPNCM